MSETCCSEMFSMGTWSRPEMCTKPAKVERDGKFYCGIHDPERVDARNDKARAKQAAKKAECIRAQRIKDAAPDLAEALKEAEWAIKALLKRLNVTNDEIADSGDGGTLAKIRDALAKAEGTAP